MAILVLAMAHTRCGLRQGGRVEDYYGLYSLWPILAAACGRVGGSKRQIGQRRPSVSSTRSLTQRTCAHVHARWAPPHHTNDRGHALSMRSLSGSSNALAPIAAGSRAYRRPIHRSLGALRGVVGTAAREEVKVVVQEAQPIGGQAARRAARPGHWVRASHLLAPRLQRGALAGYLCYSPEMYTLPALYTHGVSCACSKLSRCDASLRCFLRLLGTAPPRSGWPHTSHAARWLLLRNVHVAHGTRPAPSASCCCSCIASAWSCAAVVGSASSAIRIYEAEVYV